MLEGRKREWGFVVNGECCWCDGGWGWGLIGGVFLVELRLEAFGGGDGDEEYDDRVEMGERFGRGWGVL